MMLWQAAQLPRFGSRKMASPRISAGVRASFAAELVLVERGVPAEQGALEAGKRFFHSGNR